METPMPPRITTQPDDHGSNASFFKNLLSWWPVILFMGMTLYVQGQNNANINNNISLAANRVAAVEVRLTASETLLATLTTKEAIMENNLSALQQSASSGVARGMSRDQRISDLESKISATDTRLINIERGISRIENRLYGRDDGDDPPQGR